MEFLGKDPSFWFLSLRSKVVLTFNSPCNTIFRLEPPTMKENG